MFPYWVSLPPTVLPRNATPGMAVTNETSAGRYAGGILGAGRQRRLPGKAGPRGTGETNSRFM